MTSSTSARALIAPHVQAFFTEHLCHHKRVSPQTLASCRDTFRLLLTFVKETVGIEPSALRVTDLMPRWCCGFSTTWNTNAAMRSAHATFACRPCAPSFGSWPCGTPRALAIATRVSRHPTQAGRYEARRLSEPGRD